jgi:hypothetical protein
VGKSVRILQTTLSWLPEIMKLASSYAQITTEEEALWEIDVNLFLSEETSVPAFWSCCCSSAFTGGAFKRAWMISSSSKTRKSSVFPSLLTAQSPLFFSTVWTELTNALPIYQNFYIDWSCCCSSAFTGGAFKRAWMISSSSKTRKSSEWGSPMHRLQQRRRLYGRLT